MIVMTTISGIDAAPSVVTMTGAMPVTRIVPGEADDERAPPVRLLGEAAARVVELVRGRRAWRLALRPCDSPPPPDRDTKCGSTQGTPQSQGFTGAATLVQGIVVALHTPTGQNVAFAPIAPRSAQRIYLRSGSPRCRVPRSSPRAGAEARGGDRMAALGPRVA